VKNLYKFLSIIIIIIASNSYSFAAEKVGYLKTGIGVLREYLENLTELLFKEVIKFILKYVPHVTQ